MAKKVLLGLITFVMLSATLAALNVKVNAQPRQQLERARRLATEGDGFLRQKDYRAAVTKYAEAISIVPRYSYAFYKKGYSHYYLAEYSQAASDLSKALEGPAQGFSELDVYTMRWQAYYFQQNYDAALRDVQQALRLSPSSSYWNLALGDCYRGKKDLRNALAAYQKGAQLDATNADVHYFIALCHNQLGEYLQQGFAGLKAIEKGTTKYKGESWEFVGEALFRGKKYEDAAQSYEKALQAKSDLKNVYTNLSEVYRMLNRFDEAINTVRKGLRVYPDDANYYINLSWLYSLADRHQESISAGQQAVRLLPDQYMGYTNLCRAYNDTKQYALAIQTCNKAMAINPGDGETNYYLGRAYQLQNKGAQAMAYYKKAVTGLVEFTRQNPDYSDGYYLLGNAYYSVDQNANAIAALKKCLEIAPRFAKARFNLGSIYLVSGNKPAAREQYNILKDVDAALAAKLLDAINKAR
ncbi:MAG TPA: tetratricopeptide repeat protein [Pyrinomonadaceae bacterium]|jgi:tetratricopeptide (TPR) repeat protein